MTFKIGDIVYLKSGSIPMTVSNPEYTSYGSAEKRILTNYCAEGNMRQGSFHPDELTLSPEPVLARREHSVN
jgi:uncharacterized protein YodC (DUF2158 family)